MTGIVGVFRLNIKTALEVDADVTGVVAAVVKIPQAFPLFSLFMFEGESEFYHKRTVLMND